MERTQKELYWYWMASCPGVGIGSIFAVAAAGHTLEQIFADPEALLDRRLRLPEKVRAYLRARANFRTSCRRKSMRSSVGHPRDDGGQPGISAASKRSLAAAGGAVCARERRKFFQTQPGQVVRGMFLGRVQRGARSGKRPGGSGCDHRIRHGAGHRHTGALGRAGGRRPDDCRCWVVGWM